jgi:hypothetical protein
MSADRPISKEDVAVLLASALGQDKSDEVVGSTALALGFPRAAFTGAEVSSIFEKLVKAEGLVGVVARFAVSRGDVARLVAGEPRRPPMVAGRRVSSPPKARASHGPSVSTIYLVPLIAPAIGVEKARDAIETAARIHGIDLTRALSHDQALVILDEMTNAEGIIGVVARFAKARFLLAL